MLRAAGVDPECAAAAADVHLDADLRGRGVQGVDYLYYTLDSLERGLIDPQAKPVLVQENAATGLIDGQRGLGHPAALHAVELAVQKARKSGSASVAVRNSTDIFMLGAYTERIARAGLIGMAMTSGPPLVHPHGGTEALLSTNPISFAVPRREADPLVVDMATSALSSSRVRQAAYHEEPLPPGSGVGPDGQPSTDAASVRKGAIAPMADHKGFGLALCIGLLCGPMTGSGVGRELGGWQGTGDTKSQGHFFQAIDPRQFVDFDAFIRHTEAYLDEIRGSRRAREDAPIRIPGEQSAEIRRRQQRDGVAVLTETWRILEGKAVRHGVQMPPLLGPA